MELIAVSTLLGMHTCHKHEFEELKRHKHSIWTECQTFRPWKMIAVKYGLILRFEKPSTHQPGGNVDHDHNMISIKIFCKVMQKSITRSFLISWQYYAWFCHDLAPLLYMITYDHAKIMYGLDRDLCTISWKLWWILARSMIFHSEITGPDGVCQVSSHFTLLTCCRQQVGDLGTLLNHLYTLTCDLLYTSTLWMSIIRLPHG